MSFQCVGKHRPSRFIRYHAATTKKYEKCDIKTKLKEDGHITQCAKVSTDSVSVVYRGTETENWKIKEINGS
jgi:hypothetical protein